MKRVALSICAGVVLALVTTAAFAATDAPTFRRIGLYVGSNNGGRNRITLSYATSDAKAMAEVMNELGAVTQSDTILLSNPGIRTLDETFGKVSQMVNEAKTETKRVEFLMYYSGHSDEEGLLLDGTPYSYAHLRKNIEATGADVKIAILDSCSSGAFTRLKGGVMRQPFLIDESVDTSGYAFLTSSSADEASQESDRIGASFFTYYFVSALRGAADNTLDGKVTLNEAYSYASAETLARTANTQAGPQHPSYDIKLTGSGDLVLTDLRVTTAALVLDEGLRGKLYVRDSSGRLVAEVRKYPGAEMTLSLPAGKYAVDLENGSSLLGTTVVLQSDYRPLLDERNFRPVLREDTRSRGGSVDESLVHVNSYFSLFPTLPLLDNRRVVHGVTLSTVGDSYRVDGFDLALASIIRDELRGTQLTATFGVVGGNVDGLQAAGVFNVVGGAAKGAQMAGVFNIDAHAANGAQAAGVFNITNGDARSVQAAGVFNLNNGSLEGAQLGGVFNINAASLRGAQSAGVFNVASGPLRGVQTAGVFNVAGGDLRGGQAAGVFNIGGRSVRGVQAAGVFNVATDLRGAQVGVVNVSGEVRGVQVGVVNIAREMHGLPIGLISISRNGLHNPSLWTDGVGYGYGGFQIGSGPLYTIVYGGLPFADPTGGDGAFGFGLGVHSSIDALWLDVDLSAKRQMNWNADTNSIFTQMGTTQTVFPSLRAALGYKILGALSLFGGLTLEGHLPGYTPKTVFHSGEPWTIPITSLATNLELYPQWFVGIRL